MKKNNQKIPISLILGILFLFLNQGKISAQFIGADFQYELHTTKVADTLPLAISDPASFSTPIDPLMPASYKVTLKLYFSCRHEDFHKEQPITVNEHVGIMETMQVDLKLDSISTATEYLNVACDMAREQCIKTATYSGIIEIRNIAGGYDITWGTCCWEYSVKNIDNLEMQGLAMVLHLPFPEDQRSNSSPVFSRSPQVLTCPEKIMNINSGAIDKDGDRLSYKLIQPYTFQQEVNYGNAKHTDLFPGQNTYTPLIVGRPPFKKNKYAAGYDYDKPLGESNFSIDNTTGSVDLQPTEAGRYLIGIGVSEYRNNLLLGETQRVFLLEVLSDPNSTYPPNNK